MLERLKTIIENTNPITRHRKRIAGQQQETSTTGSVERQSLTTEEVLAQLRQVIELGSVQPYIGKPDDRNII